MRMDRVAGAPISWGVCEVPGWGVQLEPDRVLQEMAALGLRATEAGSEGFLPDDPARSRSVLAAHGMTLVGAFMPVVLHDPEVVEGELERIERAAARLVQAGASMLVLAASTGADGYETRPTLDDAAWGSFAAQIDRAYEVALRAGIESTLHPHVGTMVERPPEVERVLASTSIPLCLDTGHILAGGGDPAALAASAGARVGHVHLKDVHAALARDVRNGDLSYRDAVARGMYRPLGRGDAQIERVIRGLEDAGYDGWYVLEQDLVLATTPGRGEGPVREVEACVRFLEALDASVGR
jgi:inosose dehydratase